MDELEFRRRIYANPDDTDDALIEAAKQDMKQACFWNDIKTLDKQIEKAVDVPIPEDLANKLIWQQSMQDFARHKRRSRWYIALAASVAFVCGLSFTLWQHPANVDVEAAALAHMRYAEIEMSHSAEPVNMQLVNAKLAQFGATLTADIGHIHSANYCHLDKLQSLHLIVDTPQGKMSVFILPQDKNTPVPDRFSDQDYHGQSFAARRANVMIVGHRGEDLSDMTNTIKQRLQFST